MKRKKNRRKSSRRGAEQQYFTTTMTGLVRCSSQVPVPKAKSAAGLFFPDGRRSLTPYILRVQPAVAHIHWKKGHFYICILEISCTGAPCRDWFQGISYMPGGFQYNSRGKWGKCPHLTPSNLLACSIAMGGGGGCGCAIVVWEC